MWLALCSLMAVLVGISSEPPAVAGPSFRVDPSITVGGRWESNFYQTEENEQEAYTYLVSPGISAELQGARSSVMLNYMMEAHFYDEVEDEEGRSLSNLDYTGHQASLAGAYDLTNRLTLGLDGSYYHTRYPTYYDRLSTQIWHQEYDVYSVVPKLFFDITRRLTAGLTYKYTEIDLGSRDEIDPIELDTDNTDEDLWTMNISYTPQRSVSVGVDLMLADVDYEDRIDDYDARRVRLNVQKRFRRIALDAGVGYNERDYRVVEIEDEELVTWRLALTTQVPELTGRPGYLGNVYLRPVDHVHFSVDRSFNNIGDLFTSTRFTGSVGSMWGGKLQSRIKGWYQISDYENQAGLTAAGDQSIRELKTWDISASLGYHVLKNLVLSATGGYREQDSNLEDDDYTNTYGLIECSFNFDSWKRGGFTNEALYY